MSCVFCDIVSGVNKDHEVVWEDALHIAFLDRYPVAEGHTLVIPKKHIDYVFDMDGEDYHALMDAMRTIAVPLKAATGKERILAVYEGFSIPHVHAHLVPNSNDNDRVTFNKVPGDSIDLSAVAMRLRPHFL